jgi:hypothetical protein
LQQPRIAAHRTFGAETAHDLALVASGLSGHLAQAASIPEPRHTRRVALLVPPYLRRRRLIVRAFGTEGQYCSVGLFLHNKNSHNLSSISVSVKSPLQSFPRLAEATREPKPTTRSDVVKASEGHFPQQLCVSLFSFQHFFLLLQILKPAHTILRDECTKSFLVLIRGTHSMKDTLTAATGAVVPFHLSLLDEGGVSKLVLGYAHCGMVAAARWIARSVTPCLREAVRQCPDYQIKVYIFLLYGSYCSCLIMFL